MSFPNPPEMKSSPAPALMRSSPEVGWPLTPMEVKIEVITSNPDVPVTVAIYLLMK
jgi:hypothetical protein